MTPQVSTSAESAALAIFPSNQWTGAPVDDAGNQLSIGGVLTGIQYDAENRMVQITGQSGAVWQYVYDGEGRRVEKTSGGATTRYVYDAEGNLAAEYGVPTGTPGATFPVEDHLGSIRGVLNSFGTYDECDDYLPFGQLIGANFNRTANCFTGHGDGDTPMKFTSKERDAESGLDFFGARYMSSAQGRFTSPDPVFVTAHRVNDPQQWNLYAYSRNNPLRFTDPTGLDIWLQGCGDESDTCHKGYVGSYDDNGSFNRTHLTGPLTDSATLGTTGVSVNYNGGTYQGVWDTNKNEQGEVLIGGSGTLSDLTFTLNGNCNGTCQVSGIVNGTATDEGLQSLKFAVNAPGSGFLQNPGLYGIDPFHVGRVNFLGYDPSQAQGLAATHIPLPGEVLMDPKTKTPTNVDFHVDQRYPFEDVTGFANHIGSIGLTLFNDVRSIFTGLIDHGGK